MLRYRALFCFRYEREKSIANFKKEKYFNVHLKADGLDAVLEKVFDPNEADRIKSACDGHTAVVKSVRNERKTVNPPKLYTKYKSISLLGKCNNSVDEFWRGS